MEAVKAIQETWRSRVEVEIQLQAFLVTLGDLRLG